MDNKRVVQLGFLITVSIVLNIVESLIPTPLPGVKLGLANIVTLFVIFRFGYKDGLIVLVLRILLASLLRGNIFSPTFFLSISGGLLAYIFMVISHRIKSFSIIGISVLGAIGHSIGQILMAIILVNSIELIYMYLPLILMLSIPTGILTGMVANKVLFLLNEERQY